MAASATAQMTADRREVFIESSQFVTSALLNGPAKSRWPCGTTFVQAQPNPHRARTFTAFKPGRCLLTRSRPMLYRHVTDGSGLPILHCGGRFLAYCRGSDRGMVLVDRSKAHAEIGSGRTGVPE